MIKIPEISVLISKEKEVEIFMNFLDNSEFRQHRFMIFNVHPKLQEKIESGLDTEDSVRKFIDDFYFENENRINEIIKESSNSLAASNEALYELGKLMQYEWSTETKYEAYPTILPFSPFNNNQFYFSILRQLFKNEPNDTLYVAIHEISHFIFFDLLKKIEIKNNLKVDRDLIYYFKECLTTVLLNQKNLKALLNQENILGNKDIRDIYIRENNNVLTLIDYVADEFKTSDDFMNFLEKLILTFHPVSKDFSNKREFWNTHGKEIFHDSKLMDEYKTPISI